MVPRFLFGLCAIPLIAFVLWAYFTSMADVERRLEILANRVEGPTVDLSIAGPVTWEVPRDRLVITEGKVELLLLCSEAPGAAARSPEDTPVRWTVDAFTVGRNGQRLDAVLLSLIHI